MHENRNILYIAHERKLGGATRSLLALIGCLKDKGYQISVVVPTSNCAVAQELKKMKIPIISIFMPWWEMPTSWNRFWKILFFLFYKFEFVEVWYCYLRIRKKKIDIVHSNSGVIDFGAKLAQKLHCRHVWHFREYGMLDYNLQPLLSEDNMWRYINTHADKQIYISNSLCQYFKRADQQKAIVIYNGISENYMYDRTYKRNDSNISFLIAGNLQRGKGQWLVVRAAEELIKRNIVNFRIKIAGTSSSMKDSQKYEQELKEFIVNKKLSEYVEMLGRIEDMMSVRKQMDVEIVASFSEAFGRVTVEAMFAGMPVIATNAGANVELIQDMENGLLFKREDYLDLANCMEYLITHQQEIIRMGKKAYQESKCRYTAKANAEAITEIYECLLNKSDE